MEACIISTAQQASPKVIHISEPVRAQLMMRVGGGDEEALLGHLGLHRLEIGIVVGERRAAFDAGTARLAGCELVGAHSHSSAPFFHS